MAGRGVLVLRRRPAAPDYGDDDGLCVRLDEDEECPGSTATTCPPQPPTTTTTTTCAPTTEAASKSPRHRCICPIDIVPGCASSSCCCLSLSLFPSPCAASFASSSSGEPRRNPRGRPEDPEGQADVEESTAAADLYEEEGRDDREETSPAGDLVRSGKDSVMYPILVASVDARRPDSLGYASKSVLQRRRIRA
ncbi:uncharacterized protein LOC105698691 [Orussus abietinus]|uniref:uncharacterized protein LOC105698691 n=1 Tax=Orussus abietinus TaxID=222816 RepID=UPI0006269947|nr:uncharacterized protein LOC105698691 [Orussus abietinus]